MESGSPILSYIYIYTYIYTRGLDQATIGKATIHVHSHVVRLLDIILDTYLTPDPPLHPTLFPSTSPPPPPPPPPTTHHPPPTTHPLKPSDRRMSCSDLR